VQEPLREILEEGTAHWYAVHTKPHQEWAVAGGLLNRGIETYLPVLRPRRTGPGRRAHPTPFFSGYLFARLDLASIPLSSINWSPGVNRVVSFGGQPAVVQDEVLDWLKRRLAQLRDDDCLRGLPLKPGDRLRVTRGPLRDMEAIFDQRLSSQDRVRVLVDILGRLTACDVDLVCLKRIDG
jgi:transcriptional antiterminator RfaH